MKQFFKKLIIAALVLTSPLSFFNCTNSLLHAVN